MRCIFSVTWQPIQIGGVAHYQQALVLAQSHGMRPLVAHCHLGLGKLYGRAGQLKHASENLATATTMYHEMDMGFFLERGEADIRAGQKSIGPSP